MADADKIVRKLNEAKFCDRNGDPKPCFQYMHQTQSLTNTRIRSILLGIANYYKLANNRRRVTRRVSYILRHSVAKMYAAKYKLATRAKVFRKGGKYLHKPLQARQGKYALGGLDRDQHNWFINAGTKYTNSLEEAPEINLPKIPFVKTSEIPGPDLRTTANSQQNHFKDPILLGKIYYLRGMRALELPCVICGSNEDVEMHHIRDIKSLKGKTAVETAVAAVKRKQIPLCRKHHLEAHGKRLKT